MGDDGADAAGMSKQGRTFGFVVQAHVEMRVPLPLSRRGGLDPRRSH